MDTMWKWLTGAWDTATTFVGDAYDTVTDFVTGDESYDTFKASDFDNFNYADQMKKTSGYLGTALDFAGGFLAVAAPDKPIDHAQAKLRGISGTSRLRTPKFKAGSSDLGFTPRINDAIMRVNAGDNPSIKALVEQMRIYNGSGRTINLANYSKISVGTKTKKPSFAPKYYG
jgi:hypothetical protein